MEAIRCGECRAPGRLRPLEGGEAASEGEVVRVAGSGSVGLLGPAVGRGRRGVGGSSDGGAVRGAGPSCRLCAVWAAGGGVVPRALAFSFLPFVLYRFHRTLTNTSGLLLWRLRTLVSCLLPGCCSCADGAAGAL